METIKVKLDKGAIMPKKAHSDDAGWDIFTPLPYIVKPFDNTTIDTGVHIQIPSGYVGLLKSKSGLNINEDIVGEGVIDAGYTGEIRVKLYNLGHSEKVFEAGDKIIQLVIVPIITDTMVEVDELEESERGDNGFGSTGK